jgi:hypothetical protein
VARRWLLAAVLPAVLCGCRGATESVAPAHSPTPDPAQAAVAIFDKYVEAVGGREAAERIETYALKGTFEMTGRPEKLPVEVYFKRPDKSLMVIDLPGLGKLRRGQSGGAGWSRSPFGDVVEGTPGELTEVERDHDIYGSADLRALYREVRLESRGRLGGRDVFVVEGRPEKGPAEKMLFDAETGLLSRWDVVRRRPGQPTVHAKVSLDDYRDVGGVRVPFTLRYFFEPRELVLRIAEARYNVPLDDAMFERPKAK